MMIDGYLCRIFLEYLEGFGVYTRRQHGVLVLDIFGIFGVFMFSMLSAASSIVPGSHNLVQGGQGLVGGRIWAKANMCVGGNVYLRMRVIRPKRRRQIAYRLREKEKMGWFSTYCIYRRTHQ
jgi:hypothetical protein